MIAGGQVEAELGTAEKKSDGMPYTGKGMEIQACPGLE